MSNNSPQDTPRAPSSYPESPHPTVLRSRPPQRPFSNQPQRRTALGTESNTATTTSTTSTTPQPLTIPSAVVRPVAGENDTLIPTNIIDTPTQRLYVVGIFGLLQAWKLYDISRLWADEDDITTLWFCLKWWFTDAVFFWNLPYLRIPWLRFDPSATLTIILWLAFFDLLLPHVSGAPIIAVFSSLWKLVYDRELSISERRVKWNDIIYNDTHIMGKYTVHILPEGAAKLNPDGNCFCLGPSSPVITVPIKINGTTPIKIQLTRADLDTGNVDTMNLQPKEIKKLIRQAPREDAPDLRYLPYTIKTPGLYRLTKVRDVSELDVRIQDAYALVVRCPQAKIKTTPGAKKDVCKHDMSDLSIQLEGLAPLSVTYSRVVKGKATTLSVGRIHPENYESPLLNSPRLEGHLRERGYEDLTAWGKRETLDVALNDSMTSTGDWLYEIDQVTDGCGNLIDYKAHQEEGDSWLPKSTDMGSLGHKLAVHERPSVRFGHCDLKNPLQVPRGSKGALPVKLDTRGSDAPYHFKVAFTPQSKLGSASEHAPDAQILEYTWKTPSDLVMVKEPGLYSLRQASSAYCTGDVYEPASCLVVTPPEPSMTMEHDEILDKCTKSSVGLNIDLTLVGSPPFSLQYRLIKDKGIPEVRTLRIDRTRHQERFTPEDPGNYTYEFFRLDDKNYEGIKLDPSFYCVEQAVKPTAGAHFVNPTAKRTACIDEPVEFEVKMVGDAPWNLQYDLIHNGKRVRYSEKDITSPVYKIKTPPLTTGGEHSLALTSVEDQNGCKVFLESEAKVSVRFQRPKAQFSPHEGKMSIRALEGKAVKVPLRLSGEAVGCPPVCAIRILKVI